MPIFEYECTECGEVVEHLQLSSDSPLAECPKCQGVVRKRVSAPAFQFKGTGWYVTDYAGKSKSGDEAKAKGNGSDGSSDTKAASSASTESKPSAPKEGKAKAKTSSPSD